MFALIPVLFFLSGFTALIYQMVWMRELILVFGASMFAISTLLTAFMGGLALGSWIFGKRADKFQNPLFIYALLEVGIGAYAFIVPLLFSILIPVYKSLSNLFEFSFYAFSLVRFILAILILLLPTVLMGATLPVLSQLYKNRKSVGRRVGLLYAFNTLGAVIGVLAAGFFLLPALGLQKTVFLAAGLNGLISLLAFFLGRLKSSVIVPVLLPEKIDLPKKEKRTSQKVQPVLSRWDTLQRKVLLTVFAISGLSAMIYEVVWTRILTLILGSTVYSYATMLSTYLMGLAIGSFIFSLLLKRFFRPLLLLTLIQGGIALFGFLGEFVFPRLPDIFVEIMSTFHTWRLVRDTTKFILSAAVMLLPTILMGGVFPLVIHILTKQNPSKKESLGSIVGWAYAVNTVGTIIGSFAV
ncbi:MAG: fused MFS/spermidine synthase, partial [Nitrospiria bacterium]